MLTYDESDERNSNLERKNTDSKNKLPIDSQPSSFEERKNNEYVVEEIAALKSKITEKDQEIAILKSMINERDEFLTELISSRKITHKTGKAPPINPSPFARRVDNDYWKLGNKQRAEQEWKPSSKNSMYKPNALTKSFNMLPKNNNRLRKNIEHVE